MSQKCLFALQINIKHNKQYSNSKCILLYCDGLNRVRARWEIGWVSFPYKVIGYRYWLSVVLRVNLGRSNVVVSTYWKRVGGAGVDGKKRGRAVRSPNSQPGRPRRSTAVAVESLWDPWHDDD